MACGLRVECLGLKGYEAVVDGTSWRKMSFEESASPTAFRAARSGAGCRVQGFRVQGSGFKVQGSGFRGSVFRMSGVQGFRVQESYSLNPQPEPAS